MYASEKNDRRNWTREELIVAFNLYCKTPFGRIHTSNPDIATLAKSVGRTSSAVAWKLANFARLDPSLKKRAIAGASHGGKGEVEIWKEFNNDWDRLSFESERLLAQMMGKSIEETARIEKSDLPKEGKEREAIVRVRVNQSFFRSTVLAAYNRKCCITGLSIVELLNASHIVPWASDPSNRVNPHNGLCLNVIHDRAFDRGLLTITRNYKVRISSLLKQLPNDIAAKNSLTQFDGVQIRLPNRFLPDSSLLAYHNKNIFRN